MKVVLVHGPDAGKLIEVHDRCDEIMVRKGYSEFSRLVFYKIRDADNGVWTIAIDAKAGHDENPVATLLDEFIKIAQLLKVPHKYIHREGTDPTECVCGQNPIHHLHNIIYR